MIDRQDRFREGFAAYANGQDLTKRQHDIVISRAIKMVRAEKACRRRGEEHHADVEEHSEGEEQSEGEDIFEEEGNDPANEGMYESMQSERALVDLGPTYSLNLASVSITWTDTYDPSSLSWQTCHKIIGLETKCFLLGTLANSRILGRGTDSSWDNIPTSTTSNSLGISFGG